LDRQGTKGELKDGGLKSALCSWLSEKIQSPTRRRKNMARWCPRFQRHLW